jgi:hypothetical protein
MIDGQQVSVYIVSAKLLCSDTFIFYNNFPCSCEFCFTFVSLFHLWLLTVCCQIIFAAMDGKL